MNLTPFLAILLLYSLNAYCQDSNPVPGEHRCAAHEIFLEQLDENPDMKERRKLLEKQVELLVDNPNREIINGILTIPVVFHVIHNGEPLGTSENIEESYILSQLKQINDDFRRLNSNADNTWPQAADLEVEFCLAKLDPSGNSTSGILRHQRTETSFSKSYMRSTVLPTIIWDRNYYLNIVSADLSGSLLGFGSFPGGPADEDAVVCDYKTIGSLDNPNPIVGSFRYGRTATHEIGHWCNLKHIWGDDCSSSNSCSGSDQVNDTPNQACYNLGLPSGVVNDDCNSTPEGVMYQNFMDYTGDAGMNMFTSGQKDRLHASITTYRPLLITSLCGNPTLISEFNPSDTNLSLCLNDQIQFTDLSTGTPDTWQWTFSGAGVDISSSTDQNPSVTCTSFGTLTATLLVSNSNGNHSTTKNILILEDSSCTPAVADFLPIQGDIFICTPSNVQLIDQSLHNPTSWLWTFSGAGVDIVTSTNQNPVINLSDYSSLTVGLTVSNNHGSNTLTQTFNVLPNAICEAPQASFSPSTGVITIDGPTRVDFLDESTNQPQSWDWDFSGAGTNLSNIEIQNPSITVTQAGMLNIELRVSNIMGEDTVNVAIQVQDISSPCPPNYTGNNTIIGTATGTGGTYNNGDYETDGEISSIQLIPKGIPVDYDSAMGISLDQGFEVKTGAVFDAVIDGCNQGAGGGNLDESTTNN